VTVETAKPLPHNLDAERAVLGAGMLNEQSLLAALTLLGPEQFFAREHQLIFRRFQSLFASGRVVDLLTLTDSLRASGDVEKAGGVAYLSALIDGIPHITNVEHYAQIVREQAKLRELIYFGNKLQSLAWGEGDSELSAEAIGSFAIDSALHIAAGEDSPVVARSWPEVAESAFRELESAHDRPESIRRFRCGITSVDEMTGCLRPRELAVIVAPTSNGKTQFAAQCAMQCDRDGFRALYFSAEMPAEQIVQRELAYQAGVKFYYVRRPEKLSLEELERLKQASQRKCQVQFVDRDITPTRVW
jgi:replicative DNA helicase